MQLNITQLSKKAIAFALKLNWIEAIKVNNEILLKDPKNIDAKLRLGRAYLNSKEPLKAKKMFKEVLAVDPINQVAFKNLELLKDNASPISSEINIDTNSLIKEPGTSAEISFVITAKNIRAENLLPGEKFITKLKKKSLEIYSKNAKKELLLGEVTNPDIVNRLIALDNQEGKFVASYIKGKDKNATVLIKTTVPVFKSDKQDIRPYIKKGSLDEPEIEDEELELPTE